MQKSPLFLLLLLVLLLDTSQIVSASSIATDDLESLTDEELELICVERGFELVDAKTNGGVPLTHEDYVDAARRCLAIEEDMNEILEQNPELADELLQEIDRMKEEKERLEREREEMLATKDKLEQQLAAENEAVSDGAGASSSSSSSRTTTSTGFAGTGSVWGATKASSSDSSTSSSSQQSTAHVTDDSASAEDPDFLDLDDSPSTMPTGRGAAFVSSSSAAATDGATLTSSADATATTSESAETSESPEADEEDQCDPTTTTTTTTDSTSPEKVNDGEATTDFTLKGFIQEMMNEFEKDVHRITTLVLPVVKPLFNAGGTAWKYAKLLFRTAQHQLQRYREKQQQKQKEEEEEQQEETADAAADNTNPIQAS